MPKTIKFRKSVTGKPRITPRPKTSGNGKQSPNGHSSSKDNGKGSTNGHSQGNGISSREVKRKGRSRKEVVLPVNKNQDLVEVVQILQVLTRRYDYTVRDVNRAERSADCFLFPFLEDTGLPQGEYKSALARVRKIRAKYVKTGETDPRVPVEILGDLSVRRDYLLDLRERRKQIEKRISHYAQKLPVHAWWVSIPGCSSHGLGTLVGHAGNIGTFRSAGGLWKRMGLLNRQGWACRSWAKGSVPKEAGEAPTKEEWVKLGYAPKRRSAVYRTVNPILLNQGPYTGKDGKKPKKGPYGPIALEKYQDAQRKHPDWKDDRKSRHVHRCIGQRVLKDLWLKWKETMPTD